MSNELPPEIPGMPRGALEESSMRRAVQRPVTDATVVRSSRPPWARPPQANGVRGARRGLRPELTDLHDIAVRIAPASAVVVIAAIALAMTTSAAAGAALLAGYVAGIVAMQWGRRVW